MNHAHGHLTDCGLPGIKPTYRRAPAWPASPFGTVAHIGPMARTVTDAALLLDVLSELLTPKRIAEVQLTLIDGGADVAIKGIYAGRLAEIEQLTAFALAHDVARLKLHPNHRLLFGARPLCRLCFSTGAR